MMSFEQFFGHFRSYTVTQCKQQVFIFILAITALGFLCSLHYTSNFGKLIKYRDVSVKNGSPGCGCESSRTGEIYDFCYVDPQNNASIGKKFDCVHLETLEKLNLVNNSGPFVNLSEDYSNQTVFVSAISDNHFDEFTGSIREFYKSYPNGHFILYSLALVKSSITRLQDRFPKLEIRDFDTNRYPKYVETWMEYRFKPLIVAEVMIEYSNIMWIDASPAVKDSKMVQMIYQEISEKRVPMLFFTYTGHSNFAVLFPEVLEYFPTNSIDLLKSEEKGVQLGANKIFVMRTPETVEIFKWWILCALDKDCMAPKGAQVYCSFKENRFTDFADCFRFDQSIINLLLLNIYQDHHKYYSKLG